MFNCKIEAVCDLCGKTKEWESQEFRLGTPIKVQVPVSWHLIAVDGEGRHANVLACEIHEEFDIVEAMQKAAPAGPEPTIVHPKR